MPAHLPATLGVALGSWLSDRLAPGQTLGVGWGRTLHWSVRALRRRELPGLTVVSLLGGIGRGSEINMYETASRVAETLGAQCYYLAAPAFASSQALRDMLLAQAGLRRRAGARRAGPTSPWSASARWGRPPPTAASACSEAADAAELEALGAVGDLLCTFLDAEGRPVDHPLNRCAVGLPVSRSEARAGGRPRLRRAREGADHPAALVGGYVNHLITDERTAELLTG